METVCEVALNLLDSSEARRVEIILRQYLLRTADQMSATVAGASSLSLFNLIPHPYKKRRFAAMLLEGDVAEKGEHSWTFNLTDHVREFVNEVGIFFSGKDKIFFGLTDPKFIKNGRDLAAVIVNEKLITLYIPDSDKGLLSDQGINLDSPVET